MQAEEAVEINDVVSLDGDGRPHRVIGTLAVWHHDVEPVSGATLEDDNEALLAGCHAFAGESCAREKCGDGRRRDHRKRSVFQKDSSRDAHGYLLWNSGEPRINPAITPGFGARAGSSSARSVILGSESCLRM